MHYCGVYSCFYLQDGAVALWNIKSLTDITLTMTRKGHKRTVLAVDVSETNVISGSADSTIMVQSYVL